MSTQHEPSNALTLDNFLSILNHYVKCTCYLYYIFLQTGNWSVKKLSNGTKLAYIQLLELKIKKIGNKMNWPNCNNTKSTIFSTNNTYIPRTHNTTISSIDQYFSAERKLCKMHRSSIIFRCPGINNGSQTWHNPRMLNIFSK